MSQSFLSAETLLRCRLLTQDGSVAGLTDLILDTQGWLVRFLAAEAQEWAPDRIALLPPRLVAEVDETRGMIALDLTAADLHAAPQLAAGEGLGGFDNADIVTPPHWREHWRNRIAPEAGAEPQPAPAEGAETAADLAADPDYDPEQLSAADLVRLDTLRGVKVETADGTALVVQDLLIDDSDWSVSYLDLLLRADRGAHGSAEAKPLRCLLPPRGIDWLNTDAGKLHLTVWMQELRDAPTQPLPVAGGEEVRVRVLEPAR